MRMSNEEYAAFVDSLSPRSPIWGDLLRAGLVGGAICVVGQALVNLYEHWGASAGNVVLDHTGVSRRAADGAGRL